jgi:hypothetical protein
MTLSGDERAVLMGAAWALVLIDHMLKHRGFDRTYARLIDRPHSLGRRVSRLGVGKVSSLVDVAARWTIGIRTSCLRRAILLTWLLRSSGRRCDLVAGVGRRDKAWVGHAWVEVDGTALRLDAAEADVFNAFRAQLSRPDPDRGSPNANSPIDPSRK